jgi:hypothetical protein
MPSEKRSSKRLSLAPLTTEEALRGLMAAGPHPRDTEGKPARRKRDAAAQQPKKGRRPRRKAEASD